MTTNKIIHVPLDAEARNKISSLVYSEWTIAFEEMKAAKIATWENNKQLCPKGDWHLFHADRLKSSQEYFDSMSRVKEQICKYAPFIHGE